MSKLDLLAITETWIKDRECDKIFIADLENALPDFNIHLSPRIGRRGGGVCVICARDLV